MLGGNVKMKYKVKISINVEVDAKNELEAEEKTLNYRIGDLNDVDFDFEVIGENLNCEVCDKPKEDQNKPMCNRCIEQWKQRRYGYGFTDADLPVWAKK